MPRCLFWAAGFKASLWVLLAALNTVVSLAIFTLLFAAIYKVLPDTAIPWRDLALEQEQFKGA